MTAMPAPTGKKSNMEKGWPVRSSRTRETMMFGDVPISVMSPPSREPNASGIISRDGDALMRRENWSATGMKIASAPIFFMKADSAVTAVTRTAACRVVVVSR